jgi:hypothetical protein
MASQGWPDHPIALGGPPPRAKLKKKNRSPPTKMGWFGHPLLFFINLFCLILNNIFYFLLVGHVALGFMRRNPSNELNILYSKMD